MTSLHHLTTAQLRQAIALKQELQALESQLDAIIGGEILTPATQSGGRRTFSAATKAKMAAAQKARWAKANGGQAEANGEAAPKKRRKMSAAGRAKIAAAAKARWAKVKASGKNTL